MRPIGGTLTTWKALQCLTSLGQGGRGKTISQLATETGFSRPAVGRALDSLISAGFVVREGTRGYRLSLHLFDLAKAVVETATPVHVARAEMVRLVEETKHFVSFIVLEENDIVLVERVLWVDGAAVTVAARGAGHWARTSSGRVLVAFAAPAVQSRLMAGFEGDDELFADLQEIRRRGYDQYRAAIRPGVVALSVPILDQSGVAIAALVTNRPDVPEAEANQPSLLGLLLTTADRISRKVEHWDQGAEHL